MVGGPTRIPLVKKFVSEVIEKEVESGVDPMEAVAMGAAIQAGIIAGDVTSDIVLLDVTPLTLGIETMGGVREPLIERNTTIPTSKSKVFTTAADNQTAVTIHVVQGERPMANDNVSLGSFNLTDLPPAPRGIPQIEVKFDIDANGIINVTAKDLGTQKEATITIESNTKLSKDEIEKLKEDAEKFSEEDKKKKEKIDLKNEAESFIYTTEKLVNHDLKDKITQEQGIKVTDAVKEVKEVLDKEIDELKPKLETLKSTVNEITTELYKQINKLEKDNKSKQLANKIQNHLQLEKDNKSKQLANKIQNHLQLMNQKITNSSKLIIYTTIFVKE
jgi:molecular chaperone DnaK